MSGFALGQIIIRANEEIRLAIAKLEVEESGREVARFQGNLSGYKKLIAAMCAEFHLSQFEVEDNGDTSCNFADMTDAELDVAQHEAIELQNSDEWKAVIARIDAITEESKSYLLYSAQKSRDLDLKQGEYKGMLVFRGFFFGLEDEVARRKRIAEDKAREPDLPFDQEETPEALAEKAGETEGEVINVDFQAQTAAQQ